MCEGARRRVAATASCRADLGGVALSRLARFFQAACACWISSVPETETITALTGQTLRGDAYDQDACHEVLVHSCTMWADGMPREDQVSVCPKSFGDTASGTRLHGLLFSMYCVALSLDRAAASSGTVLFFLVIDLILPCAHIVDDLRLAILAFFRKCRLFEIPLRRSGCTR